MRRTAFFSPPACAAACFSLQPAHPARIVGNLAGEGARSPPPADAGGHLGMDNADVRTADGQGSTFALRWIAALLPSVLFMLFAFFMVSPMRDVTRKATG